MFGRVALVAASLAFTAVVVAAALGAGTAGRVSPPGRIAYVDGLSHALVTARPDGTDRVTVVPNVVPMGGPPSWSPSGRQIAYVSVGAADHIAAVWVVDATGENRYTVGDPYIDPDIVQVARWSPNGRWIAYQGSDRDSTSMSIWSVPPAGGEAELVGEGGTAGTGNSTDWIVDGSGWSWSPDGTRIAFTYPLHAATGVAVTGVGANENARPVARGMLPAWSPDGKRLVLATGHPSSDPPRCAGLWIVPASGGTRRALTRVGPTTCDSAPAWSPDGKLIAFTRTETGRHAGQAVWVVKPNGSGLTLARRLSPGAATWPRSCKSLFWYRSAWQAEASHPVFSEWINLSGWIVRDASGRPRFVPVPVLANIDWHC